MPKKNITPKSLHSLLEKDEAILIDVRSHDAFKGESIKGAINILLDGLTVDLLPKTDKKIVFYCDGGKHSDMACAALEGMDTEIMLHSLKGGMSAWKQEGYETIHSSVACESKMCETMMSCDKTCDKHIEDKIRVIFGSLLFLFIFLGHLGIHMFYTVALVMAGLFALSGVTGKCMMRCWMHSKCCDTKR